MPRLVKLRFVSLGHPQARMDDLTLDFQGPDGQATDSTLWLRNGGGKSSILNLFFAIVRPHKGEFLGGKAEAKQRSLNDYVLTGDRAVAAAEWQLDPAADSLGFEAARFVTGVFYERRDGSGELRRLFFSSKVDHAHPESTLAGLPLFTASNGSRSRRTLGAFREAWRSLRDRAPHLGVADTENQREWQEILEAARIDPELYSYQVRMNQREGGADELFRFAEAEDFVDFLLALALDPALGDRVGRNITAFRRELLQRKERLVPERDLVTGLLERMAVVRTIRERRHNLREIIGRAGDDLETLVHLGGVRLQELDGEANRLEARYTEHTVAAETHEEHASRNRTRAAQLRRHGADLRLRRLQQEHEQVQEEWRAAQHLAKVWGAAVPLRRALQFEEQAREQRRSLQRRESEHAPLRAELELAAHAYAGALTWRARELRKTAREARTAEDQAREEARECRRQSAEAGKAQSRAETETKALEEQLRAAETRRNQLVRDQILGSDEAADVAVDRWDARIRDHEDAISHFEGEIIRIDQALDAFDDALNTAREILSERHSQREHLEDRFEEAAHERTALEGDAVLRAALELETFDADRIGEDALGTLDQAARAAQKVVIERRLAVAGDERSAVHIEEHGLLPPSPDAQRVCDFLQTRLGGQAWSGWAWIEANVPGREARAMVRRFPLLAEGVVVRPDDLERAAELVDEAGLEPDAPLLIAGTDALHRGSELPGVIVGPKESAWFDRTEAQERLTELREHLEQHRQRIQSAETQHRDLTRSCEALRSFRARYPVGWFGSTEHEIRTAAQMEEDARTRLADLQEERRQKSAVRKQLEVQLRSQERELATARSARQRVHAFLEDHGRPSVKWREELEDARTRANRAALEATQWLEMATAAEDAASSSSDEARVQGEEARVLETERSDVEYIDGEIDAAPGSLDQLRDLYRHLRSRYEEKVGADALLALAKQNEDHAKQERTRLARLLSPEITEQTVLEHLSTLTEADTVDQVRQHAETKSNSLLGKRLNHENQMNQATQALEEAEDVCRTRAAAEPLQRAPSTPELAEAEASSLEADATTEDRHAESQRAEAVQTRQAIDAVHRRRDEVDRHVERLRALQEDYQDLLGHGVGSPVEDRPPATVEESVLPARTKELGDVLRGSRGDWQALDSECGAAISALRSFAANATFERLESDWLRRIQEHDEPGLEDASERLCEQLELRRTVLEEQIAGVERHRSVLVDELHAVAEEGMKLLRQASSLSKLPDHVPGIGGGHFLRIQTQEPDDPAERRARLADLIDELLDGRRDLGGVALVQAAVRRLARPVRVRVLHPDPALDRRTVSIPEMARSSGGEQLTGAILLYCTLARVRGRSRGLSRNASSVLVLDNPIGRASRVRFLELQRDVARAMGVQLIYTTGVNDHEALRALPNIIRLRNERVDRNSGRRLVEYVLDDNVSDLAPGEGRLIEAVRVGRREDPSGDAHQGSAS